MKAMVMAAGLGTRLKPLTYEVPKPILPVGNRPVLEQILRLLAKHGFNQVVANLHWFPDTIQGPLGDGSQLGIELTYSMEQELLGTAGGVRNVRDFFGDEPFLVLAGDALTDVDLRTLADAHAANDGVATLAVKRVRDTSEYGVIITSDDGRIQGFQEKPDPAEALSDLANCMMYAFDPAIFDHFPDKPDPDFALDVFPALLEGDIPFHVHEVDGYWNDVGSLPEYVQGNLDAVEGLVGIDLKGTIVGPTQGADHIGPQVAISGKVLVDEDSFARAGTRIDGPCVVGSGVRIGKNARIRNSVLLPGAQVPADAVVANAIIGTRALASEG